MKELHIYLENEEFEIAKKMKGLLSWHNFFLVSLGIEAPKPKNVRRESPKNP